MVMIFFNKNLKNKKIGGYFLKIQKIDFIEFSHMYKIGNSKYFSRKKLCQNKIGTFHLKHPVCRLSVIDHAENDGDIYFNIWRKFPSDDHLS
jgi:hypothetical protein